MSLFSYVRDGVLVAEAAADHASVAKALREWDNSLRLIPPGVMFDGAPAPERFGYRVYRWAGGDREPEFICFWGDEHNHPYPLSHGLVERVKQLDKNTRAKYVSDAVANELLLQERQKQLAADNEALKSDYLPMEGRSPMLHRSQSLRRARDKQRARGKKV